MKLKHHFSGIAFFCSVFAICSCGNKQHSEEPHFTKADSLTDTYLELKDGLLETWNTMINDDNQKIKSMQNLLHELKVSNPSQREEITKYEERLDQLVKMRYNQKTMFNAQVVEEYDFASNSLVSELIAMSESQTQFAYNTTLQKLVESIRTADQRVENYRQEYDSIARQFNQFLDENQAFLKDVDSESFLQKRPLFQMVAEE
jgi:septal ring factor EnvC (AmiA/AmiB activator)